MSVFEKLEKIQNETLQALESKFENLAQVEDLRLRFLGKKGELTLALRETGKLSSEERPRFGLRANEIKQALQLKLDGLRLDLERREMEASLQDGAVDVSLPGRSGRQAGHYHLLSQVMAECCAVFQSMGFNVEDGPQLEDGFHNFDALGFPPDHPSRDSQDSYFLGDRLLRTHTSTVQVRVMQSKQPPIRMLAPGRVYRRDQTDATHAPQFHQLEGLAVDVAGKISFAHLKGTLDGFAKAIFGRKLKTRYRPSFFPFTEPSVEMDVECFQCKSKGCGLCKQSGWIEILGAGMVDPEVFKAVDYPQDKYQGFAFGMGIERIAMLKYGISDIRLFFENDLRFLEQF